MEVTIKFSGREVDQEVLDFIEGMKSDANRRIRQRRLQFIDECRAAESLTSHDVEYLKSIVSDD